MAPILYLTLREIEATDAKIRELGGTCSKTIGELQKEQFAKHENNPVLQDAIRGRHTIEQTLQELAQVRKGIRKILPWKKDKAHNQRLAELGDLLPKTFSLQTNGIFVPDNFVTGMAYITTLCFGAGYLAANYLMPGVFINPTPEFLAQTQYLDQVVLPAFMSVTIAPIMSLGLNQFRFHKLPLEEAKYLDLKVTEFYK